MNKEEYIKEHKRIKKAIKNLGKKKENAEKKYIEANKIMCVGKKYEINYQGRMRAFDFKILIEEISVYFDKKENSIALYYGGWKLKKNGELGIRKSYQSFFQRECDSCPYTITEIT